ncbi:MAG: trypsin-like peptidase domain-containing protein, partial [Gemmatimonadetes bacterium]|nr:trypsin-like peptidase domain-containing protein [Gemmatimonadota bacterium]
MQIRFLRIRRAAWAAAAFLAGVVFVSAMDWVPHAIAQGRVPAYAALSGTAGPGAPIDFSGVAARVTPAVVSIRAEHDAHPATTPQPNVMPGLPPEFQRFFQWQEPGGAPHSFQFPDPRQQQGGTASGSGFIVSSDGYVLTNNHVVDGADRLTVGLPDRREFKAKVVGRDPQTDVAVLKIDGKNLPTVPLGDDEQARVGEWVLAIGNPLQLDFTVTAGIISAKERANELRDLNSDKYAIQDFIQTDAAINPGNSGGPLVNTRGEVIGINSAIASPTGAYAGYCFAIPITLAKTVMDDLIAHGHVRRAILGALIADITQEDAAVAKLPAIAGVKVEDFSPADDSPAKRAGMEPGDIIVAADGKPVDRVSTLQRIIRMHQPGDEMSFEDVRYGTHHTLKVKLAEAPGEATAVASNGDGGSRIPRSSMAPKNPVNAARSHDSASAASRGAPSSPSKALPSGT